MLATLLPGFHVQTPLLRLSFCLLPLDLDSGSGHLPQTL